MILLTMRDVHTENMRRKKKITDLYERRRYRWQDHNVASRNDRKFIGIKKHNTEIQ